MNELIFKPTVVLLAIAASMALLTGITLGPHTAYSAEYTTPARGSAARSEVMDALRKPVATALGQPVIFAVEKLRVGQQWAFLYGSPKRPDGKAIDYSDTRYAAAIEAGAFEDTISALLRRSNGKWKVLVFEIGATDVPWHAWPDMHGAPVDLFP